MKLWIEIVKRIQWIILFLIIVSYVIALTDGCVFSCKRILGEGKWWVELLLNKLIRVSNATIFTRKCEQASFRYRSVSYRRFFFFFSSKRESFENGVHSTLREYIYIQHGIKNFFGKLSFAILIISRSNKIFPSSSAQHWCNSYKRYTHTLIKVYPTFTQSRIDKRSLTSSILVDQSRLSRIGKYLHLTALLITFLYILHVKNIFDAIFTSVPLIHRAIK